MTINPGAVLGRDFSAAPHIVKELVDGSMLGLPRFRWPPVDVRDIADLHYRAIMAPKARGQHYIGAGSFYWMADIAKVLIGLSALFDPVVHDRLFELGKFRPVSSDKARTGFGWSPRPNEDAIVTAAESLIAEGIVKA